MKKKNWKLVTNKNKFKPTTHIKRYNVAGIEFMDKEKIVIDKDEKDLVKDIVHLMGDGSPIPF